VRLTPGVQSLAGALLILCFFSRAPAAAAGEDSPGPDLSQLTLEELTKIEVSSVARKDQELYKTPAAVFVITQDDIRTSGVSSLPELFRMVPGMQVAQVTANEWAVSARGFNSEFADKMLVLIDGRSVYTEIFSGVYWDQNDVLLGDIDRIEVIRGPGGTLWGANAVNGIINIITRKAKDTPGTAAVVTAGRMGEEGSVRYGGHRGDAMQYRGYLKYLRRNELVAEDGTPANDDGNSLRGGGRLDWQATQKDWFTFHGDLYRGGEDERVYAVSGETLVRPENLNTAGGYGLARWERRLQGADLALQASYTQESRNQLAGTGKEGRLDFDFQDHLPVFHRNDVIWGAGYRLTTDRITGNPSSFAHERHHDALFSLFFEDDFSLVPNRLVLTGGLKLQHNSYTGFEVQPGVRALWSPDAHHSIWAAVSRAVRTPSVQERDLYFLQPAAPVDSLPTEVLALGDPHFRSEVELAYELGYRQQFGKTVSADLAGFVNSYTRLRNQEFLTPYVVSSPTPTLILPVTYDNELKASTHGAEAAVSWTPVRALRFQSSYAWSNAHLRLADGQPDLYGDSWSTPTNTVSARGTWNFAQRWSLYSAVYAVTRLERSSGMTVAASGAYVRLDTHISFKLRESLEFSAGGDNLLQGRHPEFDPQDPFTVRSQIPRSAFLQGVWNF
jgi:iron complex outermembrane receptor protein